MLRSKYKNNMQEVLDVLVFHGQVHVNSSQIKITINLSELFFQNKEDTQFDLFGICFSLFSCFI